MYAQESLYTEQESLHTEQLEFSLEENGNWTLTDLISKETWRGEWIDIFTMKVTGSDNSCFLITENEHGMVQLDCENMTEISILIPSESTTQETIIE